MVKCWDTTIAHKNAHMRSECKRARIQMNAVLVRFARRDECGRDIFVSFCCSVHSLSFSFRSTFIIFQCFLRARLSIRCVCIDKLKRPLFVDVSALNRFVRGVFAFMHSFSSSAFTCFSFSFDDSEDDIGKSIDVRFQSFSVGRLSQSTLSQLIFLDYNGIFLRSTCH